MASTATPTPTAAPVKAAKPAKAAKPNKPKTATKVGQKGGKKGTKNSTSKFVLDCTHPVEDAVMDTASFEKFLHDRIKVGGRAGNLGDSVTITRDKTKITVTATIPFSKQYLKYLTKKYLKKHNLRDWLRVIATSKNEYELKYFNIHENEGEEAEE
eukprot:TRINITY_DN3104_c0_g1_i1.p1 TRINITY_DN3104_c0_g1~~TRINITY_DN3104_c0_g1_i1.p1  ORF type:complete len:156 (+),score=44.36 TRINITY_DN3104_c0_g1_i1:147-614(+)